MSIHTVDPLLIDVVSWADAMVIELEQFGNLGRLENADAWRTWAAQLLNLPKLSGSIVPDPYAFDRWEDWAMRLNDGLAAVM